MSTQDTYAITLSTMEEIGVTPGTCHVADDVSVTKLKK